MASELQARAQPAIDKLLAVARQQGYLTPDDVAGVIPDDAALDDELIDAIYVALGDAGIEMREDDQDESPVALESISAAHRRRMSALSEVAEGADPVSLYLREIGTIPLLTAEDEQDLARRYELGRAALERLDQAAAGEGEALDPATRRQIQRQADDGEWARERLNESNLRLVVHIAKKYAHHGVPFMDLIQEGNLGLMKAAEKFDWRRGHKFSTYATWWIRQAITRALADQGRTIRVPVHMSELIAKVSAASRQLEQSSGGRNPSVGEIAAELGVPVQRVEQILQISHNPVSLEMPVGEDADSEYGEFLHDSDAPEPLDFASRELLREALDEALGTLSPREAEVLIWRYGLVDGTPLTLEEVGERFGVTRERIRQIETRAIRRLRHPTRANRLRDHLR